MREWTMRVPLALGAAVGALLIAGTADAQPAGSYMQSCQNVRFNNQSGPGGLLTADCVDRNGRLLTRQVDNGILRGITRTTLIDLLKRENLELVERPFTVEEAKAAREAFITSATNTVMPVVAIDGSPIGNGAPGMLSLRLRAEFHSAAEAAAP